MRFDAHVSGTRSELWAATARELPRAELSEVSELIVVAAHPDDETLGCGGLIARAAALGIPIRIIAVTDGSASHPRSTTVSTQAMRAHRAGELREAAKRLAPSAAIAWLGFPDGRTDEVEEAITDRLREELQTATAGTLVAVVWHGDGHRDHRIVGEIVERVVPAAATVWGYPIWMWHWATPATEGIPWGSAVRVPLSIAELALKQHAIAAFLSQLEPLSSAPGDEPVLEPGVLEHFARESETFFPAARERGRS